jgi:hypothetical protein
MLSGNRPMQALKPYQCPICISGRVEAQEAACNACQDVFALVDDQTPDLSPGTPRVAIGPTDV